MKNDYLEIRELCHHGVKGQKWGIRRYQNEDGTLTEEGKARYGVDENGNMSREGKKLLKKDRKQTEKDIKEELEKETEVNAKTNIAKNLLYNKHGTLTESQVRAAAEVGFDKAKESVGKKYGDKLVDDVLKKDARQKAGAALATSILAVAGTFAAAVLFETLDNR